jgi:hypothetical protein
MTTSSDPWADDVKAAIRAGWSYDMAAAPQGPDIEIALNNGRLAVGHINLYSAHKPYAWRLVQLPPRPQP